MPAGRPAIPLPLQRRVKVEAGHRCAIPTCRGTSVLELAHIEPWAQVEEHAFDNLILLCAICHGRYDRGEIDQLAMKQYKANLGVLSHRYGELERRALEWFGEQGGHAGLGFILPGGLDLLMRYLVLDGMVVPHKSALRNITNLQGPIQIAEDETGPYVVNHARGVPQQVLYELTAAGSALVNAMMGARSLDG